MNITNKRLSQEITFNLSIQEGCLKELQKEMRAEKTAPNIIRYVRKCDWEVDAQKEAVTAQYNGVLHHLLPQGLEELRKEILKDKKYYSLIKSLCENIPSYLTEEDLQLCEDGFFYLSEVYKSRCLSKATLSLTPQQTAIFKRLDALSNEIKALGQLVPENALEAILRGEEAELTFFNTINR